MPETKPISPPESIAGKQHYRGSGLDSDATNIQATAWRRARTAWSRVGLISVAVLSETTFRLYNQHWLIDARSRGAGSKYTSLQGDDLRFSDTWMLTRF